MKYINIEINEPDNAASNELREDTDEHQEENAMELAAGIEQASVIPEALVGAFDLKIDRIVDFIALQEDYCRFLIPATVVLD